MKSITKITKALFVVGGASAIMAAIIFIGYMNIIGLKGIAHPMDNFEAKWGKLNELIFLSKKDR